MSVYGSLSGSKCAAKVAEHTEASCSLRAPPAQPQAWALLAWIGCNSLLRPREVVASCGCRYVGTETSCSHPGTPSLPLRPSRLFAVHFRMWNPCRNLSRRIKTLSQECSMTVCLAHPQINQSFAIRLGSSALDGNRRKGVQKKLGD